MPRRCSWTARPRLRVWSTPFGTIGGLMCWEHTMNLARQALIAEGEQLHASSWPGLGTLRRVEGVFHGQVQTMAKTHALTAGCFVIVATNPITVDVIGAKYLLDTVGHYSRPEVLSLVVDRTDYRSVRFLERTHEQGEQHAGENSI